MKKKIGRPKVEETWNVFSFRMPDDVRDSVIAAATHAGMSRNTIIIKMLRQLFGSADVADRMTDILKKEDAVEDRSKAILDRARTEGWLVGNHHERKTSRGLTVSWMLVHPDGRWVQGEGRTDEEALEKASAAMNSNVMKDEDPSSNQTEDDAVVNLSA